MGLPGVLPRSLPDQATQALRLLGELRDELRGLRTALENQRTPPNAEPAIVPLP